MNSHRKGVVYSRDLRELVLRSIDEGMSKMKAHQTFHVSRSSIDDWLRLRSETGTVTDKPRQRRGRVPTISDLVAFGAFANRHQGATLSQMAVAWEAETGQKLSINTFSLTLRKIGWTRKKSISITPSETSSNEKSSESS